MGAASSRIGGLLSAAKTRTNTMQNTSLADLLGQGEWAGAANDLFGKFSGPLSQYADNALSGLQAPKPAPAL